MDIRAVATKWMEYIKKYRYVLLVLCIGIALMVIPGHRESASAEVTEQTVTQFDDPTDDLVRILSQVRGAGKVQILLTLRGGERTVYQTDRDTTSSDGSSSVRVETVIVTGSDRSEEGLTQQILAPEYRGAIVVCQGADDAAVRLAVVEAVAAVTGLGTDRISVLKMK